MNDYLGFGKFGDRATPIGHRHRGDFNVTGNLGCFALSALHHIVCKQMFTISHDSNIVPETGNAMARAKIIDVTVEKTDNGLLRATSPQMKGLHAVGKSLDSLKETVTLVLADIYAAQGLDVAVFEAESLDADSMPPWVVVPNTNAQRVC